MRKMAYIVSIDDIVPIEGADAIECAKIGGWSVVVKKGEFIPKDLVVYFEIDSWIPTWLAPFLTKPGHFPKVYNEVEGEKLKTVKLRGQISQGLVLHIGTVERMSGFKINFTNEQKEEGYDATDLIGIQKWEAPVSAQLAGLAKGNFPSQVPKTDQERIQNLKKKFEEWKRSNLTFEITEKLDGSSCTFYLPLDGDFEVCSRNLSLKQDENNSFWKAAISNDVEIRMIEMGLKGFAIQGELIGEGIQGNKYGIKGQKFYVYDIYSVKDGGYVSADERVRITREMGLNHCPVISSKHKFMSCDTVEFVLQYAESKSELNAKAEREGVVFKCNEDPSISFKAISNKFLMKTCD